MRVVFPSKQEVGRLLEQYDLVPIVYKVLSDTCTPIQVFQALEKDSPNAFILESADHNQWGRYSFIGVSPKMEISILGGTALEKEAGKEHKKEVTDLREYIQSLLKSRKAPFLKDCPRLTGGLVGYFGYDVARYLEPILQGKEPLDDLSLPECHLFLYDALVAFDHFTNQLIFMRYLYQGEGWEQRYDEALATARAQAERILSHHERAVLKPSGIPLKVTSNFTKEEYMAVVEKAKESIVAGDIFQVVPSQRFTVENPPDPFLVYRQLRLKNPSPYLYYFKNPEYQIAGASPEMLIHVREGVITNKPIAGTRPRGKTRAEDEVLEQDLLADSKEKAEHAMLVDLGRNDVGRVSRFGSVSVSRYMSVERYSTVMHLVSDVHGVLKPPYTGVDALLYALPAGTLSGAPKIRAMQIIDELEPVKRGIYGGAIGYLDFSGNVDTCIAIRTVVYQNGKAYVQAGGGVVSDSVAELEYEESQNKANAVLEAIYLAAGMEKKEVEP